MARWADTPAAHVRLTPQRSVIMRRQRGLWLFLVPSFGLMAVVLLVRRQLLSIERSSGRPRVSRYSTTRRFLELFKLESLDDLPRSQDLERR